MQSRILNSDKDKLLIGKRAKFKERGDYVSNAWGKKGVIVTCEQTNHLYLKFDKPLTSNVYGDCWDMDMLVICQGSIDLI